MTNAIMAVWGDASPEVDAEFSEWYLRQHIPERVGQPGWRVGRRYRKLEPGLHQYLATYGIDDVSYFDHPVYRNSLDNPTEWTQKMMPHFQNFIRAACRVRFSSGEATGGYILTARFTPPDGQEEDVARAISGQVLHDIRELAGVTRVQLWQSDAERSLVATKEQEIRTSAEGEAPFTAVIEAYSRESLDNALGESSLESVLYGKGVRDLALGTYQLMFTMNEMAAPPL